MLEKTLDSPLDSKEIKSVSPKGTQPLILIGGTDVEAEAPLLWSPDVKSWQIGKIPDAGKDWGQEEAGVAEDEVVGCHHQFNGHEFELMSRAHEHISRVLGGSEGQGSLVCCRP